ncbi:MAG TPA: HAD hydrolase-like protein [Candidatus Nanoarchaeia archaeon]|nr:HAD hydrolase-like protein [Candidatus Nanoarchaeia archaeon]
MKMYIFDFDDTLIDNFEMDYESFRAVVEENGFKMIPKQTFREMRIKGLLADKIMKTIAPTQADVLFRKRKAMVMDSCFLEFAKVRPHVHHTFEKIKSDGHIVCIATRRKNRSKIQKFLETEKIAQYVTMMLCGDDVKGTPESIKQKMYQLLMKKYEIDAEYTIVIGNTESDLLPAQQLGIKTIAVDGTYTKKEALTADIRADFKMIGEIIR